MSNRDKEFKREAVRLALTSSQAISKTARDLGIKAPTLYSWVNSAKDKAPVVCDEQGKQTNLVEELNYLRKETARLREEREILKKATEFFAREGK